MSFPPLHPSQNPIASGDSKSSSAGSTRPRQSAWGLSAQSSSRRGLAPLSTDVLSSDSSTRRPESSTSPSATASPFAPTFSSVLNSSNRLTNARNTSSASSSASLFAPIQTGSQQPASSQLLSSPRSRATTPFSTSNLASSAAASTTASEGGGGGSGSGGGPSKSAVFSPSASTFNLTSPTNTAFDRSAFNTSTPTASGSNQSVPASLILTQIFILLGSIKEKEGKAWDLQAEQIRKVGE